MTLKELKAKCKKNGWDIERIYIFRNKPITKCTRLYRVRQITPNGSRSHDYKRYVRRDCSTCRKENMVNISIYLRKGFNNNLKNQFGYAKRNFCSHKCRVKGISGKNHYMYKEGRVTWTSHSDYIQVKTLDHPNNRQGYIAQHRWIMEKHLGRYLKPVIRFKSGKNKGKIKQHGELVHHIDMDKHNNDISNLSLCTSVSHHIKVHASYNDICAKLMKDGIVGFKDDKYYLIEKEATC